MKHRRFFHFALFFAVFSLFVPSVGLAQDSDGASRFTTDRRSEVSLRLPGEEPSFSFIVFGDRTSGTDENVSVLADAVRDANLLEPDLVMNIGDMVQGYNTTEQWIPQMSVYKGIMKELNRPWFPTPGNHDLYWRGPGAPENWHEKDYETHFGPLWYAFEHKNCWFIVLLTDETNPEDGKKAFNDVQYTKMSEAQQNWLRETLKKAQRADHVFVFQHHPRWRGGKNYGKNWEPVHQMLVEAGNVSAVFAGHIHFMHYEKRDGIEYVTLATTGGRLNPETAPRGGYLDEFHLVSVRKNRLAMAAVPVSAILNPREITQKVHDESLKLYTHPYATSPEIVLPGDGCVDASVVLPLENFTSSPLDATARLHSGDSRWEMSSHPQNVHLQPGEKRELKFSLKRAAGTIDGAFREPFVQLDLQSHLSANFIPIPRREVEIAMDIRPALVQNRSTQQLVLEFFGHGDMLRLPPINDLKDREQITLETWFCAKKLDGKSVLLGKKANTTELALQLIGTFPRFAVPIGASEVLNLDAPQIRLETDRWYHLAGVYDHTRSTVEIYLDGQSIAREETKKKLASVPQDLILGSEIDRDRNVSSSFEGLLDSVRFSKIARYTEPSFNPQRDFSSDEHTLMLLDMQEHLGRKILFSDSKKEFGRLEGDAKVVPQ